MSRNSATENGVMLDLWRPPRDAGDPVGCLATTYTFKPGLFEEECLARFLDIESEPNREDLPYFLERENRLGAVYAGVLVDHSQAGVEHSLRWDVLPVRVRRGKQHAKVSLLAWARFVRIIVASANLSEQGYRANQEVALALDHCPTEADPDFIQETIEFFDKLIDMVPDGSQPLPTVQRAKKFLLGVTKLVRRWKSDRHRTSVSHHLACTLPANGSRIPARSSLDESLEECRRRGGSPAEVWVASPFFDGDSETANLTAHLCKAMSRLERRDLCLCIPAKREDSGSAWRISAPKTLLTTPQRYDVRARVEVLPERDTDKNVRPWHAKMIQFRAENYTALMIGSSNFTGAGMGVGSRRNAEANLLTVIREERFSRLAGQLESIWQKMPEIGNPETAEWRGADQELEEEEQAAKPTPAHGFLAAIYTAGDRRQILLLLDPEALSGDWSVRTASKEPTPILGCSDWQKAGCKATAEIDWNPPFPPVMLVAEWDGGSVLLPLNVADPRALPPPSQLEDMTADDMLNILAASDPSAAFRLWAKRYEAADVESDELDNAVPIDLDPLKRYDIHATFLHRVRNRARVFAQLRANLQRPASGHQALEWRLRGLVGIEALSERLFRELDKPGVSADEGLLTLVDFLIVLREIDYQGVQGSLSTEDFETVFKPFLKQLARELHQKASVHRARISNDLWQFWERVVTRDRA
jgi:hypothetical protein